ncbi:hypothetical protein HN662_03460 [Candidatus Woesearchaeota archaeon]|nr:hypothetical protein [Candidatus Woesearchaeota archaeon]
MTVIPVRHFEKGKFLFFATRKGTVKRTSLDYFSKPRRGGIIALGLNDDDALITVKMTDDKQKIILATKNGRAVKFKETDIRSMGRTATGVRGIRVKEKDELVGMIVANDENTLLTITNKGYGKQTKIADYRLINRGGGGVINIKCTDKNGHVVSIKTIEDDEDLLIISKNGVAIRTNASAISTIGRNTQGVRVMKLKETDSVVAVAKCAKEDVEDIVESDLNPDKPDQVISVKKTVQPTEESDYESLVETVEPVQEEVMEVDEIPIKKPEEAVEEVDEPIKEEVKEPVQEEVTEKSSEEVVDEPVKEVVEEAVDEPVADSVKEEVKEPVKEEVVVEEPKKPEEDNASDSEPSIKDLQKRAEASGKSPVVDQEEVDDAVKKIQAGKVIKKNPFLKRIFGK